MKEDETKGARSTQGRDEKGIQNTGQKTWREQTTQKT
jgi:hypothetical protein